VIRLLNRRSSKCLYERDHEKGRPTPFILSTGWRGDDVCLRVFEPMNGATKWRRRQYTFYIFGNSSTLALNGDDGDDTFLHLCLNTGEGSGDASVDGAPRQIGVQLPFEGYVDVDGGNGQQTRFVYGTILDDCHHP